MLHILRRLTPNLDRRWVIGILILGVLVGVASFIRWGGTPPPLELVVVGPGGAFEDTLTIPAAWADTATTVPDAVVRVPLILAVRNPGLEAAVPGALQLSIPVRYRLTGPGGEELEAELDPTSPLIRYSLETGIPEVEPQRLPMLLPVHDTLWLELVIPAYYCVSIADSIPEFIPAPPPPLASLAELRLFYSFEGSDPDLRQTGTIDLSLDTAGMGRPMPEQPPSFPMESNPELASPDLGALTYVGSRRSRCGAPEDPMELFSTVWETPTGGRMIALDYGGVLRKQLYDLNGDGVIERESWDPERDGVFDATRRARLPIPEFLLPLTRSRRYDLARFDTIPPDSLARLDPFRRAMRAPGDIVDPTGNVVPMDTATPTRARQPQPLGRPIGTPIRRPPPDTSG